MNTKSEQSKNTTTKSGKKEKIRESNLKQRYNLSIEEYENLLRSQNGQCKICKATKNKSNRRLSVDHCHKSGKIRGLLCNHCNVAIGMLKDNPELLKQAISYLKDSNETFINRYRNKLKARYDMVCSYAGRRNGRSDNTP